MPTKINPTAVDWDEVPDGTIASGKNLGLDSNDALVKASVSGGGSNRNTFVTDNFGMFKFSNNNLFGHPAYTYNSRYYKLVLELIFQDAVLVHNYLNN